jgi:hypothetical protein
MAIKKSTPPPAPKDPSRFKISNALTVLGRPQRGVPGLKREAITDAQLARLKAMVAKMDAEKAKAAKSSKKDAKIVKKMNKKPLVPGRGATKTATKETIGTKKKPVIKVTPRGGRGGGGMRGGGGIGGFGGGLPDYNR